MDNLDEMCAEDVSYLHSNWMALASVNFKRKIFIKSTETEATVSEKNQSMIEITDSASEFYQEVIQTPPKAVHVKPELPAKLPRRKKIEKIEFSKEVLFRLAMNDEAEEIRSHIRNSHDPEINAVDAFGWTALMMAACEGSCNSFQMLLDLGADLNISDRCGNSAISLARKNNRQEILDLLNNQEIIEISDDDDDEEEDEAIFCPDCKIQISSASSKSHETSTVHLINCKFKGNTDIKSFGIARSNKGYKLMKTLGWDGSSALGSRKNGKLYPIKTVLRKGRSGLGIKQGSARITHFKAHDVRAIKFQSLPRAPTRKEIEKNSLNDKQREKMLRRELS